jgi:hypothetical protein
MRRQPWVSRVAMFWNAANLGIALQFQETPVAARVLGLQIQSLAVRGPDDVDPTLAVAIGERAERLMVLPGTPIDPDPRCLGEVMMEG